MAKSTTTVILVLTIIAALFAITTTARPCKTIFFITTTTTSTSSSTTNQNQNPNHLTFFITEIHQFHRHHHHRPIFPDQFPQNEVVSTKSSVDSSLKDRTIDIMSIVGSLLFGVGCGAFTAAVMYSIWYYCSDRTDDDDVEFDSDDDEEFDDVEGNKKNGDYVAVANADKEVPPTADEVDAMKK